jgi:hypothetical protein
LEGGPSSISKSYIIAAVEINESTYEGNAQVIDTYHKLLKWDTPEKQEWLARDAVIPLAGDGLTIERLEGLQTIGADNVNGVERLDHLLFSFGWFHAEMAMVTSIRDQHMGTAGGYGIYHAAVNTKRKKIIRPNHRGPWYHHIQEIIFHMLEAHILDCFLVVSGVEDLSDLLSCSPEELLAHSEAVYHRFASAEALDALDEAGTEDAVLRGAIVFIMDALHYLELVKSIKCGDVGRMKNLIPHILCRMVGGKNKNYARHFMELLHQLRNEWNDDIRYESTVRSLKIN